MTPTKLCPRRQSAADMREAAAHAVFVLGKGERTAAAMRNLKLPPCTCSPGIVAAARRLRDVQRDQTCSHEDVQDAKAALIRAIEEDDHD